MNALPTADLVAPVIVAALGLWMAIAPRRHRKAGEQQHAARLAKLEAGEADAFFEERRSLLADRPPRTDRGWRIVGAALALIGMARVVLTVLDRG